MVNWTTENLEKAIDAVKNGLSQRKAAFTYNIPLMTLNDKIRKKYEGDKVGSPTRLGPQCEALLVSLILFMADIGMALKKCQVIEIIKNYLIESENTGLFANNEPTDTWYYGFLNRHPVLSTKIASSMQALRAVMTQPEVFDSWFKKGISHLIILF